MSRVVLVTGVSQYLGGRLARSLQNAPDVERVVGVDVVPPRDDLGGVEFVRADIRNPVIAKVINAADIDTVVHMNVIATPFGAGGRSSMKEINVIGTMQLLAACQRSPSVERLVVKSSTTVYGVSPKDPALFTEDMEPRRLPRSGFAKDSVEVEGYVRGFARRRPDVAVTMLRFANVFGPAISTPLTRYFSLPVVPVMLGFDARLQLIHEDDALAALRRCAVGQHKGTFNVAGDGMIMLSQAVARAGRVVMPVPPMLTPLVREGVRRAGLVDFSPEQVEFMKYGRGVDTTKMREVLGFVPDHTTLQTFDAFVQHHPVGRVIPADAVRVVERQLLGAASHVPGGSS